MPHSLLPVILSGGSGSRLWPMSRSLLPKQFLSLTNERTLLQDTVRRASTISAAAPLILCNESHRFLVADQLEQIGAAAHVILEPAGRSTAAAIAAAALLAEDPEVILLVLASDHIIGNAAAFSDAVSEAARLAREGHLVTFGIRPTSADSAYGYLEAGDALFSTAGARRVRRFVEKPPSSVARDLIQSGNGYWNSGMFVFTARVVLEELAQFRPDILAAVRRATQTARLDLDFLRLGSEAFLSSPSDSIDRAVMEKTGRAAMVPALFSWSDVGSWGALWDIAEKDVDGNALRGDVQAHDTHGSLVFSDQRLIATLGVDDLIVVDSDDALLVAHRSRGQEVRDVVERLKASKRAEHLGHRRVYRPWGHYETIDEGTGYLVKRLSIRSGAALSLQLHHHRAEHWVVVSGRALVTRAQETFELLPNQSTYIPPETRHRLENPGDEVLILIEVQSGAQLSEDDIVRFEDRYARR